VSAGGRNVWILGATSAIAHAYARRKAAEGTRLLLIGRNEGHLRANAADLLARGASAAPVKRIDLAKAFDCEETIASFIVTEGHPDEVLIAYGILGEQSRAKRDIAHAREIIEANFTSVAAWLLALIAKRDPARPLTLVVIGSVAGDRGRASNFVYGSAKGGLDRFLEGLQHEYAAGPLSLVRVKPGFVDTPMTAGIAKGGPLWASPDKVAADIERAVARRRAVVYTPWFWWPIMTVIRNLPCFVFNRLKI
jgi:decaprenylphospho-beta-D-erythro-pentofuranosid-2-ulose 2-reductase